MSEINIKQKKFVDFYIESGNAKTSYLKAGYEAEGNTRPVKKSHQKEYNPDFI
jgi:phage terminase small subunit